MEASMTFVLVGPNAGKTIILSKKYQFTNGELHFAGSIQALTAVRRVLANYHNAHPKDSNELKRAQELYDGASQADSARETRDPDGLQSRGQETGDRSPKATGDDRKVTVEADSGETGMVSSGDRRSELIAAIEMLDPANQDNWTKSGEPRVEVLSRALGRPVTRTEIAEALGIA